MLFLLNIGQSWCSVVTLETLSSNLNKFEGEKTTNHNFFLIKKKKSNSFFLFKNHTNTPLPAKKKSNYARNIKGSLL